MKFGYDKMYVLNSIYREVRDVERIKKRDYESLLHCSATD